MKKLASFVLFLFSLQPIFLAQGFQYVSSIFGIQTYNNGPLYGGGVSFCDFNEDGWDDLTFCLNEDSIVFYVNNGSGFTKMELIDNNADAKQPTWVDYDNDGDKDLFVTRKGAPCMLFRNDGFPVLTDVTVAMNLPIVAAYNSYGCSWGDYDNDSFLDVYICNYNWLDGVTNWLLHNNGNGTFTNVTSLLGVGNGSKPSFQSVWVDFNFDGWLDLYLVNDKFQVNALYMNNNGTFSDYSAASGLNVALDSMCNSISDVDNDGDFDIYISNTASAGNYLMENNGMDFENIAEAAGVEVNMLCWGSLFIDFDNNGWDDIHSLNVDVMNGNQNYFFINQQNNTFIESSASVGLSNDDFNSYANAKGDFNNDGYYDIIETNTIPITQVLYRNVGSSNNYLKFGLEGTVSNSDGVGTFVEYWVNGNHFIKQTLCGGNYIAQDSQYVILGLGNNEQVDSLFLHWPSGWIDHHTNLSANQFINFTEGETFSASIVMSSDGICENDTMLLSVGEYESYHWSTNETSPTIVISEPGLYFVEVSNEFGFNATAEIIVPLINAPEPGVWIDQPSCFGSADGSIELFAESGDIVSVTWSNMTDSTFVSGLTAGEYSYVLEMDNGCTTGGTLTLDEPEPLEVLSVLSSVSCNGGDDGNVQLIPTGGTGTLEIDWLGLNPQALPAGDHHVVISDANDCFLDYEFNISEPEPIVVTFNSAIVCYSEPGIVNVEISGGTGNYSLDWNGVDTLEVYAGDYELEIVDGENCSSIFNYSIEENPLITAEVQIVNANDGNNGSAMVTASGGTSPYSYSWDTGSQSSVSSNLAQGIYLCTITDFIGCVLVQEVTIIDLNIGEFSQSELIVYPNPAQHLVNILNCSEEVSIETIHGQLIRKYLVTRGKLSIDPVDLPPGIYIVRSGHHSVMLVMNE